MKPPYEITNKILSLYGQITEALGICQSILLVKPEAKLRKQNRIKTIHSSLAIEGNTLNIEHVTALIENSHVVGPKKDILEVQNAIKAYDQLNDYNPKKLKDFLKAHLVLMNGLVNNPGKFRKSQVGILKGKQVAHIAPGFDMVPGLMNGLFDYLQKDTDLEIIKSCVFHYEIEFIHPFMDGNGRIGRLWQTVILRQYSPVFEFLPVESLIKARQLEYYRILGESDNKGDSTGFIEFMLQIINESLEEILSNQNVNLTSQDRITIFKEKIGKSAFSRQDYMRHFKDISTATASRDLKLAVGNGILYKTGDKRTTSYKFKEYNLRLTRTV